MTANVKATAKTTSNGTAFVNGIFASIFASGLSVCAVPHCDGIFWLF